MPGKSLPVITARTPGRARARLASICTILAWGWGLRTSLPCSMPGRKMSSAYSAWPVAFSQPSFFGVGLPMMRYSLRASISISAALLFRQLAGGVLNGLDDLEIAGAAAEVADDGLPNLVFAGIGLLAQQPPCEHDQPWGAEPALHGARLHKRFLNLVEIAIAAAHALNGQDLLVLGFDREVEAGIDGLTVDEHGAGAALAFLAGAL